MKKLACNNKPRTLYDGVGSNNSVFRELINQYKQVYQLPDYGIKARQSMVPEVGRHIADLFEQSQHTPNETKVKAAYGKMMEEVLAQFYFLQSSDMKIELEPWVGEGEPYADSFEMFLDFHSNHMYFLPSSQAFCTAERGVEHKMLDKTAIRVGDYQLLGNDVFRIVHDVFGHAAYGYSFGPQGEELAWLTHSSMFSPLARAAITSETRGQNCWVNFGPNMRKPCGNFYRQGEAGWLAPPQRPFAKQKMTLLPDFVSGIKVSHERGQVKAWQLEDWNPYSHFIGVCN